MNFSTRLRALLESGNLKMKSLGSYLNYDLSYISKWVNGKCLPSQKIADQILRRMTKFFVSNLMIEDVEETIFSITGRKVPIDTESRFEKIIYSILEDGYYYSLIQEESKEPNTEGALIINSKTEEIVRDIGIILKKYIATAEQDIEIYCTIGNLDFFRECAKQFESFFMTKDINFKLRLILSSSSYDNIKNSDLDTVYLMMSNVIFMDIEVIVADIHPYSGYIYVKNKGFIDIRLDISGVPIYMVHSENPSHFDDFDKIVEADMLGKQMIMKSRDRYLSEDRLTEFMVLSNPNRYINYLSYLDGPIPEDILVSLINRKKISNLEKHIIKTNSIVYEEVRSIPEGYIYLSKKGLFRALREREATLGDISFNMNKGEFIKYIDFLVEEFTTKEGFKVKLINDDDCPIRIFENSLSIFATEDYVCLKKNPRYVDSKANGYFEVLDKKLTKRIFQMLEANQDRDYFEEISRDKFLNFIEHSRNNSQEQC